MNKFEMKKKTSSDFPFNDILDNEKHFTINLIMFKNEKMILNSNKKLV